MAATGSCLTPPEAAGSSRNRLIRIVMARGCPAQGPAQRFRSDGRRGWPTAARKPRSTLIFHVERILRAIHSLNCWLPDAVGVAWLNTDRPFPGVMALGTGQMP